MNKRLDLSSSITSGKSAPSENMPVVDRGAVLDEMVVFASAKAENGKLDDKLRVISDPTASSADRLKALKDALGDVREILVANQGIIPPEVAKKVSQSLIGGLKDGDKEVRYYAAYVAEALQSTASPELVKALVERVNDPKEDPIVRWGAVNAIGAVGSEVLENDKVIPALTEALKSKDALLAAGAAEALGKVGGRHDGPHMKELFGALGHADPKVRAGAVKGLIYTSSKQEVIDALVKSLDDKDLTVRLASADSLSVLATFVPKAEFEKVLDALERAHNADAKKLPRISNYLDAIEKLRRDRANPRVA